MTWPEFLAQVGNLNSVTLVGPLHDGALPPCGPTIYVDGGTRLRDQNAEKFPCISVGDGDSGPMPLDVRLPAEKDYSDLAFVLRELPSHVTCLTLYGFCGGRLDHELGNLGELHRFLAARSQCRVELWRETQKKIVGFSGQVSLTISGLFSVMTLEPASVTITGAARYLLEHPARLQTASTHGLSNSGSGLVLIGSDRPCFIFID